jgi:hypothetical protein
MKQAPTRTEKVKTNRENEKKEVKKDETKINFVRERERELNESFRGRETRRREKVNREREIDAEILLPLSEHNSDEHEP